MEYNRDVRTTTNWGKCYGRAEGFVRGMRDEAGAGWSWRAGPLARARKRRESDAGPHMWERISAIRRTLSDGG